MSKKVVNQINKGILPQELNFFPRQDEVIDWEKVRYNTFKDPEFYLLRLPKGMENIPGVEKICQSMAENSSSPLEEIEGRRRSKTLNETELAKLIEPLNMFFTKFSN